MGGEDTANRAVKVKDTIFGGINAFASAILADSTGNYVTHYIRLIIILKIRIPIVKENLEKYWKDQKPVSINSEYHPQRIATNQKVNILVGNTYYQIF